MITFCQVFQLIYSINLSYSPFVQHVVSILCTLVWTRYKHWMDSANYEALIMQYSAAPTWRLLANLSDILQWAYCEFYLGQVARVCRTKEESLVYRVLSCLRLRRNQCLPAVTHYLSSSSIACPLLTGPNSAKQEAHCRYGQCGCSHTLLVTFPKITLNGYCTRHLQNLHSVKDYVALQFACCLRRVLNLKGRTYAGCVRE
jgi:hypothetical protein